MEKIILRPFLHRGESRVGVFFRYNSAIKEHLKLLSGLNWSKTHSCYYLADTNANRILLRQHLEKGNYIPDVTAFSSKEDDNPDIISQLSEESAILLEAYISYLKGKRYSASTIKTYSSFVSKFLHFTKTDLNNLKNRDIEIFIERMIAKKNYSISTHRQCVSAFVHLVTLLELPDLNTEELHRPGKSRFLPVILSQQEVIDLLVATRNIKHRAVLALLYASGLRIGELLKLKLQHIDIDRKQILVKQAKGRKDRYVGMADSFIPLLLNYLNTYKPERLFVEGVNGTSYSPSSIRAFLKDSCKRAGIKKKVSPHSLRHAYATHMLENGIGLRYIQALLGHSRPETTMLYTQVTQMDMVQIKSPLDMAVRKLRQDNSNKNLRLSRNENS